MKRTDRFWGVLLGLLALLGVLAACGGGGGGGGGAPAIPASYTGVTNQAGITCENAATIVKNAWELSTKQEVIEVATEISGDLFDFYPEVPPQIYSDCGDTSYANVQLQIKQVSETYGTFNGRIEFVNYCVNWEEPFDINGLVTFKGSANETAEGYVVTMVLTFYNVQKKVADNVIYTITEGSVAYDVTLYNDLTITEEITYNHVLRDESTGRTYWFDDLETRVFLEYEDGPVTATFDGRFYDHVNGFVDIESEGSLLVPDIEDPSGILWFYGKESKARLTFDAGSTLLEVDGNNDGSFDCPPLTDIFPGPLPL